MSISVSAKPNSLNTFRYEARVGRRMTHGFRESEVKARDAAREDEGMLYTCASMERAEREAKEERE